MKIEKFICTHCGHQFESEEKEGLECPLCFWSSSVCKAEDKENAPDISGSSRGRSPDKLTKSTFSFPWVQLFISLFFLSVTVSILWLLFVFGKQYAKRLHSKSFLTKSKVVAIEGQSAASGTPMSSGINGQSQDDNGLSQLTMEEAALLNRKLHIEPDRVLSEEEQKVLDAHADFSTGMRETLPSQMWTFEGFQTMLKNQQGFYGLTLPRSYQRKLENIFRDKYEAARKAFENQEIVKARDLWVEALVFPIYANDIRTHRGVVLTMLRPFINDTLSKIGSMNTAMVERKVRDREAQVSQEYQTLIEQIKMRDWAEVLSRIHRVEQVIDTLENDSEIAGSAPPYVTSVLDQVDEGIRSTLLPLLEVPRPPLAATNAIRMDLREKAKVAESFIPLRLQEVQMKYNEGLDAIRQQNWIDAEKALREVDFPLALAKDAREKIRIIRKCRTNSEMIPSASENLSNVQKANSGKNHGVEKV